MRCRLPDSLGGGAVIVPFRNCRELFTITTIKDDVDKLPAPGESPRQGHRQVPDPKGPIHILTDANSGDHLVSMGVHDALQGVNNEVGNRATLGRTSLLSHRQGEA